MVSQQLSYLTLSCFRPSQVLSLTIFASLVTEGYQNLTNSSQLHCVLNDNGTACCYGITVGILAFLHCLLFLGFDVYEPSITTHKFKYTILVLDVTFSSELTSFFPKPWDRVLIYVISRLWSPDTTRCKASIIVYSNPCCVPKLVYITVAIIYYTSYHHFLLCLSKPTSSFPNVSASVAFPFIPLQLFASW